MAIFPYGLKTRGESLWVGWLEDEQGSNDVLELDAEGHLGFLFEH